MIENWEAITDFAKLMGYGYYAPDSKMYAGPLAARKRYARQYCLALMMEVAELTESFEWKPWRSSTVADEENIKREIVDCLIFLHHIAEIFGISKEALNEKFVEVNANNIRRYVDGDFSEEESSKK